jgi:hypothetical protein
MVGQLWWTEEGTAFLNSEMNSKTFINRCLKNLSTLRINFFQKCRKPSIYSKGKNILS